MENLPLYISDPVYNKETISGYTSYTLQGSRAPNPMSRRYKDFDALRLKLRERWPGIYIPPIPHKKVFGNTEKDIVEERIKIINKFLLKLSKIPYLYNSEEIELFLQNTPEVSKTLANCKAQNYNDILRKYVQTFTNFDENFESEIERQQQEKFFQHIKKILPNLTEFIIIIDRNRTNFNESRIKYNECFNAMIYYEKETMYEMTNKEEEKLIFCNTNNTEINENLKRFQNYVKNPFEKLYLEIVEDLLETEAMIEAYDSIKNLENILMKLKKKLTSLNVQIVDLQSGKTTIKSILSFKNKEEKISALSTEKEVTEKNIQDLEKILRYTIFNMKNEIKKFKEFSIDKYFNELASIVTETEKNEQKNNDIWESILKNNNIVNTN